MITALSLPLRFDPARLKAALVSIPADVWQPHYNESDYGGEWRGVALRSLGESHHRLSCPPGIAATAYADTDILAGCGYLREVVAAFPCPLKSVRLLSLAPGSFVREHRDPACRYEDGEMRIHVPIQTSGDVEAGVEFYLAGERLCLEEGGCYYLNVTLPHRISNRSPRARAHLVIDIEVNEWVHGIVRRGTPIGFITHRPRGFQQFRRRMLSDRSLAEALQAAPDATAFEQTLMSLASRLGFDFSVLEAGWQTKTNETNFDSRGWVPVTARVEDGAPLAEWVYLGSRRFTEPFFTDSVRLARRSPFARAFRVEAPLPAAEGRAEPAGFIFHMSRCGSTLISRALAALETTRVISEAPAIDTMLQSGRPEWLRAAVLALGPFEGNPGRYFVKFDAWSIHHLSLIREAFPQTPWIFAYRDPLEVLVSQLRAPGMHCLPGALDCSVLGMTFEQVVGLTREEWSARVLAGLMRAALGSGAEGRMYVNYAQLPDAIWGRIARHFQLGLGETDVRRMRATTEFHAKHDRQPFVPDSAGKQCEATDAVRALAAELLYPLYRELLQVQG